MSTSGSFADSLRQQLQDRLVRRALIIAGLAGAALFLGLIYYLQHNTSAGQSLNANYGRRSGSGADSVNGTGVLAHMFELKGFRVRTADRLSPKIGKTVDVIVWAPDDFRGPTKKQREYLEKWLSGGDGRTLVYIGRDYDAAADYWKAVKPAASPEDATKIAELADKARKSYELDRGAMPSKQYARWFTVNGGGQERPVKVLTGPWADGIVAAETGITVRGRLEEPRETDATGKDDPSPPDQEEPLLVADGDALAFRLNDYAWDEGQVIVVTNGSFLLNYPLINPEHRKLAGKLVDECSGTNAVFLESDSDGPEILDRDSTAASRWSEVWPFNAMIFHLVVFGIVFCLTYWPIFGRPKQLPAENPADFGRHVSSLGQLMARTQNIGYAQSRLAQYQQQARRGSGSSHRK